MLPKFSDRTKHWQDKTKHSKPGNDWTKQITRKIKCYQALIQIKQTSRIIKQKIKVVTPKKGTIILSAYTGEKTGWGRQCTGVVQQAFFITHILTFHIVKSTAVTPWDTILTRYYAYSNAVIIYVINYILLPCDSYITCSLRWSSLHLYHLKGFQRRGEVKLFSISQYTRQDSKNKIQRPFLYQKGVVFLLVFWALRFTVKIVKMLIGHKQDSYEKKTNTGWSSCKMWDSFCSTSWSHLHCVISSNTFGVHLIEWDGAQKILNQPSVKYCKTLQHEEHKCE